MGIATITKRFQFHAAHRLPNHDGQCRDLHGHTYQVDVAVSGWIKTPNGDPDEGMVLDFGVLKAIYKKHIEPYVEHKFLNETLVGKLPESEGEPLTTAENLAAWIHSTFFQVLKHGHKLDHVCITVWETPTSCAKVGSGR